MCKGLHQRNSAFISLRIVLSVLTVCPRMLFLNALSTCCMIQILVCSKGVINTFKFVSISSGTSGCSPQVNGVGLVKCFHIGPQSLRPALTATLSLSCIYNIISISHFMESSSSLFRSFTSPRGRSCSSHWKGKGQKEYLQWDHLMFSSATSW